MSEEDHSKLFKEIGGFSQRKLKKVETKVVTGLGDNVVEKRGAKGLQKASVNGAAPDAAAKRLDLQVGLVAPGLMIGMSSFELVDALDDIFACPVDSGMRQHFFLLIIATGEERLTLLSLSSVNKISMFY